jgi:hypothetical protein
MMIRNDVSAAGRRPLDHSTVRGPLFVIAIAVTIGLSLPVRPALAQAPVTIDSGMTRAQVVSRLGEPISSRTYREHTYMLYRNGCEQKCGMNDLVVLDSGRVVDAVFRSGARHYSGTSSSPHMISTADAAKDAKATHPTPLTVPAPPKKNPAP